MNEFKREDTAIKYLLGQFLCRAVAPYKCFACAKRFAHDEMALDISNDIVGKYLCKDCVIKLPEIM